MRERRLSDVYLVEWKVILKAAEFNDGYFVKFYRKVDEGEEIFTIHPDEWLKKAITERIKHGYEEDNITEVLNIKITNIKPL